MDRTAQAPVAQLQRFEIGTCSSAGTLRRGLYPGQSCLDSRQGAFAAFPIHGGWLAHYPPLAKPWPANLPQFRKGYLRTRA